MRAQQAITWLLLLLVVGAGACLRFYALDAMPVHTDEAENAWLLGADLEGHGYRFNPRHHHGPSLHYALLMSARLAGRGGFAALEINDLRRVAALGGVAGLLVLAGIAAPMGRVAMVASTALAALSPYIVYYNRVAIHESLFALLALGAILALLRYKEAGLVKSAGAVGVLMGLLVATKLTSLIFVFSWGVAAGLEWWRVARGGSRAIALPPRGATVRAAAFAVAGFVTVYVLLYSSFFSNWRGLWDGIASPWEYQVQGGHSKPWPYFLELLFLPKRWLGHWHWEAVLVIAAAGGLFAAMFGRLRGEPAGGAVRLLGASALVQMLVHSILAYKTPWLLLTAWLQLCVVAGYGLQATVLALPQRLRWGAPVLACLLLVPQLQTLRLAVFRYPSDPRNPYAYAATLPGITAIEPFLARVRASAPPDRRAVAIVGGDVWPLPWYLRHSPGLTYLEKLDAGAISAPFLICAPGAYAQVLSADCARYVALPYPLRPGYPLHLLIERQTYEHWQAANGN